MLLQRIATTMMKMARKMQASPRVCRARAVIDSDAGDADTTVLCRCWSSELDGTYSARNSAAGSNSGFGSVLSPLGRRARGAASGSANCRVAIPGELHSPAFCASQRMDAEIPAVVHIGGFLS
jgi:hypothetical protein